MEKIIIFAAIINFINAENRTINVFYLNEDGNVIAETAFEAAVKVMRMNDYKIDYKSVVGKSSTYEGFFESLCNAYSEMVDSGREPHFVMDNTIAGIVSACAKAFTGYLSLPCVSSSYGQEGDLRQWKNITKEGERYLIQILQPTDIIPYVIRALISHLNYSTAAILADEYYVMDFKYKCLLENLPTRHYIADLDTSNPISQLIHIKKVGIFNIFVLGSAKNIKMVLEGADAINMFSKEFSWHAITHENDFLKTDCRNARLIFVKPIPNSIYAENLKQLKQTVAIKEPSDLLLGYYYDLALRSLKAISSLLQEYKHPYNYIKCNEYNGKNSPDRDQMDLLSYFIKEKINPSYGPFIISKNGYSMMDFSMKLEAMTFRDGTVIYKANVGFWNVGYDNTINFTSPSANVLKNYTSFTYYRIAAVLQKPFLFEDKSAPKGYSGYCIDLIDTIAEILNFDYEINEAIDGTAGIREDDGEWTGVIRELIEKRADIGLGTVSITEERASVVDFTVPIYEMVGHAIMMKIPQPKTSLFRFIHIFDVWVWVFIIVCYILSSVIIWILYKLSPYGGRYRTVNEITRNFTFLECLWFCIVSFTPQGAGEAPSNYSGRVVTAAWWFFAFMVYSSYSANLSAFLTVSRLASPIESLDDLANQYTLKYAPVNGSETMRYFQLMADIEKRILDKWLDMTVHYPQMDYKTAQLAVWDYPLSDRYTKLWNTMLETGLPQSIDEAVEWVKESKSTTDGFVFLGDATDIRYLVLINCDYQMVGEEFHKKTYAMATQKGSPLGSQLSNTILQLLNQRHMELLKEKWWNQNPNQMNCEVFDSDSIGIVNIGGIFIFLGTGIGIFIIGLICKFLFKITMRKLKDKIKK